MDQAWVEKTVAARAAVTGYDLPGEMTTPEAYALQDAYVAGTAKRIGGYKLAINGAAQMAHFGVSEGASARVFKDEIYADGVALPLSGFGSVSVEPELCAVLGGRVAGLDAPVDRAGAIACIDRFHAAIEVIDQRGFMVPQLTLQQAIALNVFNAGIVIGEDWIAPQELDPSQIRATLALDGEIVGDVTNAAPQEPVEAVQWLINHCLARGVALEPGMVVMCGTHIPLRLLEDHVRKVEITMTGLGAVSFSLTD
jgi:2-keto-4-pentenoate hydratase